MAQTDGKDKTRLAEERTDQAGHRSRMAAERTFAAWVRTALSCISVGLGVISFLGSTDRTYLSARLLGTLLGLMGVGAVYMGYRSYREALRDLPGDEAKRLRGTLWHYALFGALLILSIGLALWIVW